MGSGGEHKRVIDRDALLATCMHHAHTRGLTKRGARQHFVRPPLIARNAMAEKCSAARLLHTTAARTPGTAGVPQ